MRRLPEINDVVKISASGQLGVVRHIQKESRECKLVKFDQLGNPISLGYLHISVFTKIGYLGVA